MDNKKYNVNVAFNREAVDYAEENGWEALFENKLNDENFVFEKVSFDTEAERNAYCKGINDSMGWIEPYFEIKK
jgi:hypothetical protein